MSFSEVVRVSTPVLEVAYQEVGDPGGLQDIAHSGEPTKPEWEATYWYQYYFHSERGREGLERNRDELCEYLWRTWSPKWADAAADFATAVLDLV